MMEEEKGTPSIASDQLRNRVRRQARKQSRAYQLGSIIVFASPLALFIGYLFVNTFGFVAMIPGVMLGIVGTLLRVSGGGEVKVHPSGLGVELTVERPMSENELEKKWEERESVVKVRCTDCDSLNDEEASYCSDCGTALKSTS